MRQIAWIEIVAAHSAPFDAPSVHLDEVRG
jgi:hypothetical protein